MTNPKTAFVTGATGFLGLNLVDLLTASGWDVTALHRTGSDLKYLGRFPARRVVGSIEDAPSVLAAMPPGVDAVFHVAADVNFWTPGNSRQTRTNVEGTRNVVAAAIARGAGRMVHVSSIAVYGFQTGYDEQAPKLGRGSWINYFRTKALAEDEVRSGIARGLDATIVNPSNIVGAYDVNNWSRMFSLVRDRKMPAAPPGRSSFCHGREVASALVSAFDRGRTGENYLLGGTEATYLDVIRLVGELLGGVPTPRKAAPAALLKAVARVSDWASRVTRKRPRHHPRAGRHPVLRAGLRQLQGRARDPLPPRPPARHVRGTATAGWSPRGCSPPPSGEPGGRAVPIS